MKQTKRIPYIDVCKGVLILLVVFEHLPQVAISLLNIKSEYLNIMDKHNVYFTCFFMPAFFYLTGYCSSFNDYFRLFFVKNFKALILPAITLGLIIRIFEQILQVNNVIAHYSFIDYIFYILNCSPFWFLKALFISKLIMWCTMKIKIKTNVLLLLSFIACFLAVLCHEYIPFNDRYCILHSVILMPAISMGQYVKCNNIIIHGRLFFWSTLAFLFVIFMYSYLDFTIPYVTQSLYISKFSFLSYILLSFLGTVFILNIAVRLENVTILQYIGKASIVIYLFSNLFMYIAEKLILHILSLKTIPLVFLFYLITFLFAVMCCLFVYYLLISTKLRCLLGKS